MLLIPLLVVALYLGFAKGDWFILQYIGLLALVMFIYGFISGKLGLSKFTNMSIQAILSYSGVAVIAVLAL
jgi:hypothetical protein